MTFLLKINSGNGITIPETSQYFFKLKPVQALLLGEWKISRLN